MTRVPATTAVVLVEVEAVDSVTTRKRQRRSAVGHSSHGSSNKPTLRPDEHRSPSPGRKTSGRSSRMRSRKLL
ncbi:hypothetical protein C439_00730 [Haloferax mediterranei ATCC 33500]|uniref:Uncharacterized protein n=1 Tax=Haloferax mediterranei (strain ATCC 33500 / DSM 1411 / JCM 8866 / NBRC 14739 / NCIMB 2177 / R-4) TaxID=523841 RepID=M0JB75_HALMT|nr:hypothetical protein BM92_18530 [Haloferax mediterranei ATCC 33500]EMA05279.1 hypothetical protein C439_00730 [Haloferax mediterranei ATCC 33500]